MLIDDVKGALAALKTEMQEDRRIKSGADLNVRADALNILFVNICVVQL